MQSADNNFGIYLSGMQLPSGAFAVPQLDADGNLKVAIAGGSAVINVDLATVDVQAITGVSPLNKTLYDIWTKLGIGLPSSSGNSGGLFVEGLPAGTPMAITCDPIQVSATSGKVVGDGTGTQDLNTHAYKNMTIWLTPGSTPAYLGFTTTPATTNHAALDASMGPITIRWSTAPAHFYVRADATATINYIGWM